MQVNNIQNHNHTSFTSVKLSSGAADTLKKVLKPADWEAFDAIIQEQKYNPVDMYLFGNRDKLSGKLFYSKNYTHKEKVYNQRAFFDSPIKFLKRLSNKANDWHDKIKNEPDVDIDEILKQIKP